MTKCILIVDDNKGFLHLLASSLQKKFRTYEAAGVDAALRVLETVMIDAICSDLNMGDDSGLNLLKMLRQRNVQIPFLLMSGMDDYRIICEVESYGAQFCSKTDPDLLMKIGAMVDDRGDAT